MRVILLIAAVTLALLPASALAAAPGDLGTSLWGGGKHTEATHTGFMANAIEPQPTASAFLQQVTSLNATTAEFTGRVDTGGEATTAHFAYAPSTADYCQDQENETPTHVTPDQSLAAGQGDDEGGAEVSATAASLVNKTEYCVVLVAQNASGPARSGPFFFVAGAPGARTEQVEPTGATTATVHGSVNPAAQSTTYHAEYGLSDSEWCTSHGHSGASGGFTTGQTLAQTDSEFHEVSVNLSGLDGGVSYCARIVAENGSGTTRGGAVEFVAGSPAVQTHFAQTTGPTTATLHGTVNPIAQFTDYYARYAAATSEWCTSFGQSGSPTTTTGTGTLPGTASTPQDVTVPLTGLVAGTEYCAQLVAQNGSGTTQGNFTHFTQGAPRASTHYARSTGATTATVGGSVNPSGLVNTEYRAQYAPASSQWCQSHGQEGAPTDQTALVPLGFSDSEHHQVSVNLTGLTSGTAYCAQIFATNEAGDAEGGVAEFTAGAPAVDTFRGSSTGPTSARIEGQVNPAGQATEYRVQYAPADSPWCDPEDGSGTPSETTPVDLDETGTDPVRVEVELTGLTSGTEYCARLAAENESGTSFGGRVTFTPGAPAADTYFAESTGANSVTLHGEVDPNGQSTTYRAQYGLADSDWCETGGFDGAPSGETADQGLGSTADPAQVTVSITGLMAGSEYCGRIVAENAAGIATGNMVEFSAGAPSVRTFQAVSTGGTSATIEGEINPSGADTTYRVQYDVATSDFCENFGFESTPAHQTTSTSLGFSDNSFHRVEVPLTGLSAGTEYCARIVAENERGTADGNFVEFSSGAPGVETHTGRATGPTTAEVLGRVNPAGQTTDYGVDYAPNSSQWCQSHGFQGTPAGSTGATRLQHTDSTYHDVTVPLTGLTQGTAYCARIVATSVNGSTNGAFVHFVAGALAPGGSCGATWDGSTGDWTDDRWIFTAPAVDNDANGYPDPDDVVCIASGTVTASSTQFTAGLVVSGSGTLNVSRGSSDATILTDDQGSPASFDGTVTVGAGGTINLTSTASGNSALIGGTLSNSGTVNALAGAGGGRSLSFATINNNAGGLIDTKTATTIQATTVNNSGTINVDNAFPNYTQVPPGHTFNQNAGAITGAGNFVLIGGTYHHNAGTSTTDGGSTTVGGPLTVSGENIDLDGTGTAFVSVVFGNSNLTSHIAAGKTLNVVGGIPQQGGQGASAVLTASLTNSGTINLSNFTEGDNGVATLQVGSHTLTNAGTIRSIGIGASGTGNRFVAGTAGTLANTGTVDVQHNLAIEPQVNSSGTFSIPSSRGVALLGNHDYVQTGGTTTVDGTMQFSAGAFKAAIQGGTLQGSGTIASAVENSGGTVRPGGSSAGTLTVTGNYTQDASGTLAIDVDGTAVDAHDHLDVGGDAALGGTLAVDSTGFTPSDGNEFRFVRSLGSVSGDFATKTGLSSGGRTYAVAYTPGPPGNARLTVVGQNTLTVTPAGDGSGTVTSSPTGIDCGSDCTQAYDAGTVVTLTASPATGSRFGGWSGACTNQTGTCQVTMSEARDVTATFVRQRTLTVQRTGSGTVNSTPAGIDCGAECTASYDDGTVVTLSATAAQGFRFTGWSGDLPDGACSGTGTCQVTMNQTRTVTATFAAQRTLNVTKTGSGLVQSSPAGIDCGAECEAIYDNGTVVTLTATASQGFRFTGWSGGGCSGTSTCQVTMDQARTVSATFVQQRTLTVQRSGNGDGSVTGSGGINCPGTCSRDYDSGASVTLSPAVSPGSRFTGWSGDIPPACQGSTSNCTVTMDQARTVTATFVLNRALTVSKAGSGSGTVTSTPSGINCGGDCDEPYGHGTAVTLTATPAAGSTFSGWSGDVPAACTGTAPCQVTMDQARTVTATFTATGTGGGGGDGGGGDGGGGGNPPPPADSDGDGIADSSDACPNEKGTLANGCNPVNPPPPADSDGDGVPDATDPEPNNKDIPGPFGATNSNDTINGDDQPQTICGLLGNDVVNGLGGNDTLFGDLCNVRAKLAGAQSGAGGNDTLNGGTGNDTVYGAGGNDKLYGGDGNDKVFGGDGNDALDGGKGRDSLDGGKGNDKLTGGADANTIKGGTGDDSVNAKNGKKDTIDCGAGKKDSASVDRIDKVKGCEKVKRAKK